MRLWTIVLPLAMFAAMPSCGSSDAPATEKPLCTPGANVFCRCADPNSEGTKRCADDGKSFSECDCGFVEPEDTGTIEEDTFIPPEDTTPGDTPAGGEDKCPGKTVAVDPMKELVIDGDTTSASNDSTGTGACAVAAGNDHVYAVIPTGTGRLSIKLSGAGGGLDPTLVVRENDCMTGNQLACGETTSVGGTETANINVMTGKTYYVWADGKAGTAGAYKLTLSLTTGSFCGDGTVDNGEGCDDGNKVAGDGCENDCRPGGDPLGKNLCPGLPVHVWPGKVLSFAGSTNAYPGTYKGSCGGSTGQDRVYAVTAHKTGTMTVELDANLNAVLYARKAPCDAETAELACAQDFGGTTIPQTEKLTLSVTNGTTYFVFVDGIASKGTFTLRFSLP